MNQSAAHMVSATPAAALAATPAAALAASQAASQGGPHGAAGIGRSGERLRWGLTGLAAIFLVVLIAAATLKPADRSEPPGAGESLAVLGVAPGPASRPAGE